MLPYLAYPSGFAGSDSKKKNEELARVPYLLAFGRLPFDKSYTIIS